jgi:hypothetical protein
VGECSVDTHRVRECGVSDVGCWHRSGYGVGDRQGQELSVVWECCAGDRRSHDLPQP